MQFNAAGQVFFLAGNMGKQLLIVGEDVIICKLYGNANVITWNFRVGTNSGIIFPIGGLMMRWVLCGLFVVMLIGCASHWEHATKRTSEFYADDRDCQAKTGGATKGIDPGQERVSYESCMWQKGWHNKQSIWFFDPSDK